MQYLNIVQIYSRYFALIDFFIFLILFLGIARMAFEKRFEGSGGKAIITAVGVSLALSLSLAEAKFGFNIGSLGAIAGSIVLMAFVLLLFQLFSSFGLHKTMAAVLSFIIAYIFLNSLSSKLSAMIQRKFPILNLIFLVACTFVIIKGISFLGIDQSLKNSARNIARKGSEYARNIPLREEKKEKRKIRDESKTIHKERKISSKMVRRLEELKDFIKEYGGTEQGRQAIAGQIESLSTSENKLFQKLQHLRDLDKKLEELDILAVRKLEDEYGKAPEKYRNEIAREIQAEKEKYQLSRKMEAIENQIKAHIDGFNISVRSCVESLGRDQNFEATQSIDKAIEYQVATDNLFKEMERIGIFMAGLTKREYKAMKKEIKEAA